MKHVSTMFGFQVFKMETGKYGVHEPGADLWVFVETEEEAYDKIIDMACPAVDYQYAESMKEIHKEVL